MTIDIKKRVAEKAALEAQHEALAQEIEMIAGSLTTMLLAATTQKYRGDQYNLGLTLLSHVLQRMTVTAIGSLPLKPGKEIEIIDDYAAHLRNHWINWRQAIAMAEAKENEGKQQ